MQALKLLALCLLSGTQEDPSSAISGLIEKIRSENVEDRDEASRRLAEFGERARPALERAARDADSELRARAKGVLQDIDRRNRILAVRPPPRRLTLELKHAPLPEALQKILPAFGLTGEVRGEALERRPVSIRLKEATLWEALDALCLDAKVRVDRSSFDDHEWVFREEGPSKPASLHLDSGDVRVYLAWSRIKNGDPFMELQVSVALPVGSSPLAADVENPRLVDDRGRALEFEKARKSELLLSRSPGRITHEVIWRCWMPMSAMEGVKSVGLEGRVVLKYPHDLQRVEFDLADPKAPLTKVHDDLRITLRDLERSEARISFHWELEDLVAGKRRTALQWFEDTEGHWICDDGAMVNREGTPGGKSSSSGGTWLPETGKLGTAVFAQFVGEDRTLIPIAFKVIPVPPPEGGK
jgi:hypothetical protein